jgi:hypothetical protein
MINKEATDQYWLAVQQDRNQQREYVVLTHGVSRCEPYPVSRGDIGSLPEPLRYAEVRMWARRATTVANRVRMRAAMGQQPSRDEVKQINRYMEMILTAGMNGRPMDQLA